MSTPSNIEIYSVDRDKVTEALADISNPNKVVGL